MLPQSLDLPGSHKPSSQDDNGFSFSQQTQEIQPTQINEDAIEPVPSQPILAVLPEKPWATLHSLSPHVPTVKLTRDSNPFGIGRHKGRLPPGGLFKVHLVIDPDDGDNDAGKLMVSRWHALIQRKGVDDDSGELQKTDMASSKQLTRGATLPNNGEKGKGVISLCDYSSNGTFINGKRCKHKKWTKLAHGDEISLGSTPGNVNKANDVFVWLVSIPSEITYPMNQLPSKQSEVCKQIYDRYDFLATLGKGAFATTWRAFDKNTGEYRAIKVIRKNEHDDNPQNLINFRREIAILETVDHPNIVKFYEAQEDDDLIWIVLELVDGGEYLDYVCNADGLDEHSCRLITIMLLHAIDYMAKRQIAHRDLKPENILMTSGKNPKAKIADFGLAKKLSNEHSNFTTHCGTPAYLAPEVLASQNRAGYTVKVDIFSLGVIVYASLGNCSPFEGQPQKGDICAIIRQRKVDTRILAQLRPNISAAALDFIGCLTVTEADKRLSAAQALKHPWIAEMHNKGPHLGSDLPENPTKTVTHRSPPNDPPAKAKPGQHALPNPAGDESYCPKPKPRPILIPNNLNIGPALEDHSAVVTSHLSESQSGKSLVPKTEAGDYQDRNEYYSLTTSPLVTEHHIELGSSGVGEEQELQCSQQLDDLHLDTVAANSVDTFEQDALVSMSKRKLRQWSTSPPRLNVARAGDPIKAPPIERTVKIAEAVGSCSNSASRAKSPVACGEENESPANVVSTPTRRSSRLNTPSASAKKRCSRLLPLDGPLSVSKQSEKTGTEAKPADHAKESPRSKRFKH